MRLAGECGFELAGVAAAVPLPEVPPFLGWVSRGLAGSMHYLTGVRAERRIDPRSLLPDARSVICVGKLYNTAAANVSSLTDPRFGWISRYAWAGDYHTILRDGLQDLAARLQAEAGGPFNWKICVDTAPLLERSYARMAGLGWIGRNTCLINEPLGSWFFLGELLTSLELEPNSPPPDRCGSCTRCIEACPTQALVPTGLPEGPEFELDSRLCISYFTIELRGPVPERQRAGMGPHVFGCDICQDVCPWNRRAPVTSDPRFQPRYFAPPLAELASLTQDEFREMFRDSPVLRAKYQGFLRNVITAMGNAGLEEFRAPLERLSAHPDPVVAEHARWALRQLRPVSEAP